MAPAPTFCFVLVVPDLPDERNPAYLRVCGVPVALRLLAAAVRAGAGELVVAGAPARAVTVLRRVSGDPRLLGCPLRVAPAEGRTMPTVEVRADVELSPAAIARLAREAVTSGRAVMDGSRAMSRARARAAGAPGALRPASIVAPVRTPSEAREAKRRIFATLAAANASPVALRMNAPISKALSWGLVERDVHPDRATAAHTLVGVLSALFFAAGEPAALLAAGLLFELASILDGVDGEIARAKLLDSPRGALVDTAGDTVAYLAYVVALPAGYAAHATTHGLPWAPLVPALAALLVGTSAAVVLAIAALAARAGRGGAMAGVVDDHLARGGALARRARPLASLGRRALFSKVVAGLSACAALAGGGFFYDALFFGTVAHVLAMAAVVAVAARARVRLTRASGALGFAAPAAPTEPTRP